MADYIIIGIIGVTLFFIIRMIIKNKQKGGCIGCAGCAHEKQCSNNPIYNNEADKKSD